MNKQTLLAGAPNDAQWSGMAANDRRVAVINLALAALHECAAQGRQLDAWESHYLRSALGSFYTGFLTLAWTDVVKALAEPNERASGWEGLLGGEIPNIEQFRAAFEQAKKHQG